MLEPRAIDHGARMSLHGMCRAVFGYDGGVDARVADGEVYLRCEVFDVAFVEFHAEVDVLGADEQAEAFADAAVLTANGKGLAYGFLVGDISLQGERIGVPRLHTRVCVFHRYFIGGFFELFLRDCLTAILPCFFVSVYGHLSVRDALGIFGLERVNHLFGGHASHVYTVNVDVSVSFAPVCDGIESAH